MFTLIFLCSEDKRYPIPPYARLKNSMGKKLELKKFPVVKILKTISKYKIISGNRTINLNCLYLLFSINTTIVIYMLWPDLCQFILKLGSIFVIILKSLGDK